MTADFRHAYLRDIIKTYRTYKSMGEKSLAQVADADLHRLVDPEANSIAIIVKHMAGNLRSRFTDFLTTDGEKPNRNRDGEFEMPEQLSREELMRGWDTGWSIALTALEALTPEDLQRPVMIRNEPLLVVEVLDRLATHAAYHVGQIAFLAKHFAGANWNTLSIPKRRI
jgi:hypothetical protein